VRELAPDLVHANTTRAGLAALPAGALGGPPVIVHQRDWVPEGMVAAGVLRTIAAGASAVIANSGYVAGQIPRGRRATRVHTIHDAVDTTGFEPDADVRDRTRRELGLARGDAALAVVAQLTPWKGQEDAIRALAQLRPRHPQARLLLAGSAKFAAPGARFDNPAYERDLRSLVSALGLEAEVAFLGEREDIPAVLAASDILLIPSWREAFGRIVVEGMAAGRPVVATSVGGPAELVRNGVDGLLVPPRRPELLAQAVGGLLGEPEHAAEMGERGRERARSELAVGRLVAEVVSVYDELVQASRP
jgi:glycosyltransferase involved in cell wall biosynthesis